MLFTHRCAGRTGLCKGSAPQASANGRPNFTVRPPNRCRAVVQGSLAQSPSPPAAPSCPSSEAYCLVDPSVTVKPLSHKDKLATVQQTLGVGPEVADELTSVLESDDCALPQKQSLANWLTELASCWTETGFPIFRVVPVLQKQPGLRFVQVETIQTTLTWLCGFFESSQTVLDEVEKHPQWLTIDSSDLSAHHASFRQLGFDKDTLREIARIAPPKVAFLAPGAPQKLSFMKTTLGRSPASVLKEFPRFCTYSLSKIIKPRVLFVLHLQHPECYDFPDLKSICTSSHTKFCSNVALAAQHQYEQFMDHLTPSGAAMP